MIFFAMLIMGTHILGRWFVKFTYLYHKAIYNIKPNNNLLVVSRLNSDSIQ